MEMCGSQRRIALVVWFVLVNIMVLDNIYGGLNLLRRRQYLTEDREEAIDPLVATLSLPT